MSYAGQLGAPTGSTIWEKMSLLQSLRCFRAKKESSSTLTVLPILCSLSIRVIATKNCSKMRINWARVSRRKRQGHEHTHHITGIRNAASAGTGVRYWCLCVCVCRGEIIPSFTGAPSARSADIMYPWLKHMRLLIHMGLFIYFIYY